MSESNSPEGREELTLAAADGSREVVLPPSSIDDSQEGPSLTFVGPDEDVDRSILLVKEYLVARDGRVHVTANAFGDSGRQTSLYRRCLTEDPPHSNPPRFLSSEKKYQDAVVTLRASAIRQETNPHVVASGEGRNRVITEYIVDIKPDLTDNAHRAHAVVYATPHFQSSKAFGLIKEKLARIANTRIDEDGWPIAPDPDFVKNELLG